MLLKRSLETKLPCAFVEFGMVLVWSFHWSPVLSRVCFCSLPHLPEQKGNVRLLFPFYRDSELDMAEQNMCMHIHSESNSYINGNAVFHSSWAHKTLWSSVFQGVFPLELESRRWDKNLPKLFFLK